jgi:EmrB/QacA subfamily drug resistance transporter
MPTMETPQDARQASGDGGERQGWILALVCLAQFMVVLDLSIVNVALPAMRDDLHLSVANLQWVVNAYTITFAGFLLLGGRAADLFGQRKIFILGIVLFGLSSLAAGLSHSQGLLIGARAAQGLGGAILSPATLTILTTTFTRPAERAKAMGAWSAVAGAGGAAGALLGGILTDVASWRWIFFVNIPITVIAAIGAQQLLKARNVRHAKRLDLVGALLITVGLSVAIYGIVGTETHGWVAFRTLGLMVIGIAVIGLFVLHEGRFAKEPLMPLELWRRPALVRANIVMTLLIAGVFAMWFFLSLNLQNIRGYSPLSAGFAFFPQTLGIIIAAQISARLVGRIGVRTLTAIACAFSAVGLAWLSLVPDGQNYWASLFVPSVLTTFGMGLAFTPIITAAMGGVEPRLAGLASGLINSARQVGAAVGLALLSTLAANHTAKLLPTHSSKEALLSGYHRGFLFGSFFVVAAFVVSFSLPGAVKQPSPAAGDDVAADGPLAPAEA